MPKTIFFQRLSNGSIDPDSDVNRMIEYQETFEKQNAELQNARSKLQDYSNKLGDMEETITSSSKDMVKCQDQNLKLQRDLREVSEECMCMQIICVCVCVCYTVIYS